ncbi:expressed protein [Chlorella variabilis]|uniref:Expressed protein n=1 Tax=Chlorella variabilis TaxID=554065 RepID=E1ZS66_CHLVA|nr:expressed protein [Chlorella variabilis]EFN51361.1 expressed protein [Chlorella variabilis]|eukprot:XP_005843463.1 expressed protein [Chlorella variabilis]
MHSMQASAPLAAVQGKVAQPQLQALPLVRGVQVLEGLRERYAEQSACATQTSGAAAKADAMRGVADLLAREPGLTVPAECMHLVLGLPLEQVQAAAAAAKHQRSEAGSGRPARRQKTAEHPPLLQEALDLLGVVSSRRPDLLSHVGPQSGNEPLRLAAALAELAAYGRAVHGASAAGDVAARAATLLQGMVLAVPALFGHIASRMADASAGGGALLALLRSPDAEVSAAAVAMLAQLLQANADQAPQGIGRSALASLGVKARSPVQHLLEAVQALQADEAPACARHLRLLQEHLHGGVPGKMEDLSLKSGEARQEVRVAVEARHATAHLPAIGTVLLNTTAAEARQLLMLSDERAAGNGDSVQEVKSWRATLKADVQAARPVLAATLRKMASAALSCDRLPREVHAQLAEMGVNERGFTAEKDAPRLVQEVVARATVQMVRALQPKVEGLHALMTDEDPDVAAIQLAAGMVRAQVTGSLLLSRFGLNIWATEFLPKLVFSIILQRRTVHALPSAAKLEVHEGSEAMLQDLLDQASPTRGGDEVAAANLQTLKPPCMAALWALYEARVASKPEGQLGEQEQQALELFRRAEQAAGPASPAQLVAVRDAVLTVPESARAWDLVAALGLCSSNPDKTSWPPVLRFAAELQGQVQSARSVAALAQAVHRLVERLRRPQHDVDDAYVLTRQATEVSALMSLLTLSLGIGSTMLPAAAQSEGSTLSAANDCLGAALDQQQRRDFDRAAGDAAAEARTHIYIEVETAVKTASKRRREHQAAQAAAAAAAAAAAPPASGSGGGELDLEGPRRAKTMPAAIDAARVVVDAALAPQPNQAALALVSSTGMSADATPFTPCAPRHSGRQRA